MYNSLLLIQKILNKIQNFDCTCIHRLYWDHAVFNEGSEFCLYVYWYLKSID